MYVYRPHMSKADKEYLSLEIEGNNKPDMR